MPTTICEEGIENILLFDMAEVNDKSQSTHQSQTLEISVVARDYSIMYEVSMWAINRPPPPPQSAYRVPHPFCDVISFTFQRIHTYLKYLNPYLTW